MDARESAGARGYTRNRKERIVSINPDRAQSRLQNMTKTKLCKFADKHHVDKTESGRNLSHKRLVARLMMVDSVLEELGAEDGE